METKLDRGKPAIMFIATTHYDLLVDKGVAPMLLERDEGGFFKRVVSVCPWAPRSRVLRLSENHIMVEICSGKYLSFLPTKVVRMFTTPLHMVVTIKTLVHLVKREYIDVIRATDPFWCGFYAWAASKLTGIPFCISIHADYEKCYRLDGRKRGIPFLFKMIERFVLPRAQMVMPIREYLAQKLLSKGLSHKRIRVIPHGVNIEMFLNEKVDDIHKQFGIDLGKKLLSFVGRLSKENYVFDMVELFHRLSKLRNDFIVLIVGDGPEREALKALAQEYNLSSFVMFAGFQTREKVISIRRQSYLAICLMGGFSLIEACMAGCPVISYDVEWHYELVKNGETGFLVKENDLEALTRRATYLLDHPKEARQMGAKARELATARHDISYTSGVKANCYKELLRQRSY